MKKILFLTGTRADFGKLKSLIQSVIDHTGFKYVIFATGMHLQHKYGYTVLEIEKSGFKNIRKFENHTSEMTMDLSLAKTIEGLSKFVKEAQPDLLVIHGDRIETLAGAIVGSLNNILVAHIEGGEISGTVDELIRHSVSKLSHIHFVSNELAEKRLIQMGEMKESIFVIGSPDIDLMISKNLPNINTVKNYYDIPFECYAIGLFHPVTTEVDSLKIYSKNFVDALLGDNRNYVIIYPNNDMGSSIILEEYERLSNNSRFRLIPSLRFEYFLSLLKNSNCIVGNSSAGVREAPYYDIPAVNIGSRQKNRNISKEIINADYDLKSLNKALHVASKKGRGRRKSDESYGEGKSASLFLKNIQSEKLWNLPKQKQFLDLKPD